MLCVVGVFPLYEYNACIYLSMHTDNLFAELKHFAAHFPPAKNRLRFLWVELYKCGCHNGFLVFLWKKCFCKVSLGVLKYVLIHFRCVVWLKTKVYVCSEETEENRVCLRVKYFTHFSISLLSWRFIKSETAALPFTHSFIPWKELHSLYEMCSFLNSHHHANSRQKIYVRSNVQKEPRSNNHQARHKNETYVDQK